MSEKEVSKQNTVEKFEIRDQNKNKTEAKWKYKVSSSQSTCFVLTDGWLLQAKIKKKESESKRDWSILELILAFGSKLQAD